LLKQAAASVIAMPFVRRAEAATRSLKIATFGGNFEDSFIKYIYPEFENATGIKVESVSESAGLEFLVQIAEATKAGTAPMDLCTAGQQEVRRGAAEKIWRTYDPARIPNLHNLGAGFVHTGASGIDAVGAMAWYQTLIVNPKIFPTLPDSWKILWDPAHRDAWGLASGGSTTLFEITAATWFGGTGILDTEDGIRKVLAKIAELKPNVKLWWESEGTMQTAYENDEVIGGMYFHDVAGVMARGGTPVVSVFPKEGGVIDFGSWCQPAASTKADEVHEFINFTCQPSIQALMTRKIGTAPLVDRKLTDLTDAEFAAASSDIPPIKIAVDARSQHLGFMDAEFTRMLTT
jgi:putative spermidine/putrescine transport system substrate-binding protein